MGESAHEQGRFFINGVDLDDALVDLQRECFAFVTDTDRVVDVVFEVVAEPEGSAQYYDVSGIQRFIGVPRSSDQRRANGAVVEGFRFTGQVIETGPGQFYLVTEMGKEENLDAAIKKAVQRTLSKYADARAAVGFTADLMTAEPEPVIGE